MIHVILPVKNGSREYKRRISDSTQAFADLKLRLHEFDAGGTLRPLSRLSSSNPSSTDSPMSHKPVFGLAGIVLSLAFTAHTSAQDFRVYTKIFDARASETAEKSTRSVLLGRSTAIFHAGKAYEYVDSGNQMTVYEPAHEQFTIVDGARRMLTVIPFEYVEHRLFQVGKNTEKKIEELREKDTEDAGLLAAVLEFQLAPKFKETYDEKQRRMKMDGSVLSYDVKCATDSSPEIVAAYLNFTDSMAQLNYLVNEKALLPWPRLELDKILRQRELLPIEVTLHSRQPKGLHLRAEHRFDWKLDATDRSKISHWEKLIHSADVKHVTPGQFFEPAASEKLDARR